MEQCLVHIVADTCVGKASGATVEIVVHEVRMRSAICLGMWAKVRVNMGAGRVEIAVGEVEVANGIQV